MQLHLLQDLKCTPDNTDSSSLGPRPKPSKRDHPLWIKGLGTRLW